MLQKIGAYLTIIAVLTYFVFSFSTEWNQVAEPTYIGATFLIVFCLIGLTARKLNEMFEWVLPAGCVLAFGAAVVGPIALFFF